MTHMCIMRVVIGLNDKPVNELTAVFMVYAVCLIDYVKVSPSHL